MVRKCIFALLCAALPLFVLDTASAQEEPPRIRIIWTTTPPVIDGILDESVWESAALLGEMTQVEPYAGEPPSQHTEVRLLTDEHNLYFGIRCFDDDPSNIDAKRMIRDSWSERGDSIVFSLDTFHDRHNGYFFQVDAAGGRSDMLFEGQRFTQEWDTIWSAKVTMDDGGWYVEIAIPYQSLNFDPESDTWGFNFSRRLSLDDEQVRWADPTPDRNTIDMGQAGILEGLQGIRQGLGLDFVPSISTRRLVDEDRNRKRTTADPSLDVFYKVTPGLTATLTANTDFSETEVDARQVDLSRFNLFFPERRAFFLQDALIFNFAGLEEENALPFFSRRIGRADDGEPIDIRAGGKLTGREGPFTIGLLGVQQEGNGGIDSKNFAVGRLKMNVLEQSSIGLIATHGDPSSRRENSLIGADFEYRNSDFRDGKTFNATAWFQHSFSDQVDEEQAAFGGRLEYPNDIVNWKLGVQEIQRNFYPGLGFVNRTSIRRYDGEFRYRIRPEEGFVRSIDSKINGFLTTSTGTRTESALLAVRPLIFTTNDVDKLELRYSHRFERLLEPFEIGNNVTLPVDTYHWDEGSVRIETGKNRPLAGTTEISAGTFYSGERLRGLAELEWRPSKHWFLGLTYDHNEIWLPEGDFRIQLSTMRLNVQFTPEISWITFAQWDSVSDTMTYNSRFRWIIQDGREFFVIFNQGYDTRDEVRVARSEAIMKLEWTFRF